MTDRTQAAPSQLAPTQAAPSQQTPTQAGATQAAPTRPAAGPAGALQAAPAQWTAMPASTAPNASQMVATQANASQATPTQMANTLAHTAPLATHMMATQQNTQAAWALAFPSEVGLGILDEIDVKAEFARDCPTLRYVPNKAKVAVVNATSAMCQAINDAPDGSLAERRGWKLLLLRERLLLHAPPVSKKAKAHNIDLAKLVRDRASPGLADLTPKTAELLQALLQPRPGTPALEQPPRPQPQPAAHRTVSNKALRAALWTNHG